MGVQCPPNPTAWTSVCELIYALPVRLHPLLWMPKSWVNRWWAQPLAKALREQKLQKWCFHRLHEHGVV